MALNQNFIAPCGLYCGVCGVHCATRDNNNGFLEKLMGVYQGNMPGLEHLTIEDIKCDGCLPGLCHQGLYKRKRVCRVPLM
jgi:hypothetical protein